MKITGNTVLITGGGSGIGRGLAESFHALGNRVMIAGRRRETIGQVAAANPGMAAIPLDISDPAGIRQFAEEVTGRFPDLNVLINNAGIMRPENLQADPADVSVGEGIVTTNLLGPLRLTAALLPLLRKQPRSVIMNVSSGLAFVPLAMTPTYCATKAAIHSWTQSLRYQLRKTSVEVLELIPPYVATDLMNGASDPRAMPLDQYIAETMDILKNQPDAVEICVDRVKLLRFAEDSFFQAFNQMMEH